MVFRKMRMTLTCHQSIIIFLYLQYCNLSSIENWLTFIRLLKLPEKSPALIFRPASILLLCSCCMSFVLKKMDSIKKELNLISCKVYAMLNRTYLTNLSIIYRFSITLSEYECAPNKFLTSIYLKLVLHVKKDTPHFFILFHVGSPLFCRYCHFHDIL